MSASSSLSAPSPPWCWWDMHCIATLCYGIIHQEEAAVPWADPARCSATGWGWASTLQKWQTGILPFCSQPLNEITSSPALHPGAVPHQGEISPNITPKSSLHVGTLIPKRDFSRSVTVTPDVDQSNLGDGCWTGITVRMQNVLEQVFHFKFTPRLIPEYFSCVEEHLAGVSACCRAGDKMDWLI